MDAIKTILVFVINSTWGCIQSSIGLILFIYFINKPHYRYKGSIITTNATPRLVQFKGAVSLGVFIFSTRDIEKDHLYESYTAKHEYGHCLQSVLLGPLYLLVIGIPSMTWCLFFRNWRIKHDKCYSWLYTESWADKWGKASVCEAK